MNCSLVVGLGNIGKEYKGTRHNIGFEVVDAFAEKRGLVWSLEKKHKSECAKYLDGGKTIILSKPTTFMNNSGDSVVKLCSYYKIPPEKVVAIYDDIAFPVGDFKINYREGTGGHNGIADILSKIGGGFVRYRIGIGQKIFKQMALKDHVLSKFSTEELDILEKKIQEILYYLQLLLDKGVEHAMNLTNRKKIL